MSILLERKTLEVVRIGYLSHMETDGLFAQGNARRVHSGSLEDLWLDEQALTRHLQYHVDGIEREGFWDAIRDFVPIGLHHPAAYIPYCLNEDKITVALHLPASCGHECAAIGVKRTREVGGRFLERVSWVVTTAFPWSHEELESAILKRCGTRIDRFVY